MNVKVIDKNTADIYCSGELKKVFSLKKMGEDVFFASIDGTIFFKIKGENAYDVIMSAVNDQSEVPFDKSLCDRNKMIIINPMEMNIGVAVFDFLDIPSLDPLLECEKFSTPFGQIFTVGTYPTERYEITDIASGDVIARGQIARKTDEHRWGTTVGGSDKPYVTTEIDPCHMISFDKKHFFWADGNDKYSVHEVFDLTLPDIEYIERSDYNQVLWRQPWADICKADVIREYSIDECDPEIQGLVYALNRIPYVHTVSSCCGHGVYSAWVAVSCSSVEGFYRLMDILKDKTRSCNNAVYINISPPPCPSSGGVGDIIGNEKIYLQFALQTYALGEEAYQVLKELESHINKIYG